MLTLRCMLSRDVSDKLANLLPNYHETAITFLQIFFTPSFNEKFPFQPQPVSASATPASAICFFTQYFLK